MRALLSSSGGYSEVVGQLLAKGADVQAQDKEGLTALMAASGLGHSEVVGQLLAKGADVQARTLRAGPRVGWPSSEYSVGYELRA